MGTLLSFNGPSASGIKIGGFTLHGLGTTDQRCQAIYANGGVYLFALQAGGKTTLVIENFYLGVLVSSLSHVEMPCATIGTSSNPVTRGVYVSNFAAVSVDGGSFFGTGRSQGGAAALAQYFGYVSMMRVTVDSFQVAFKNDGTNGAAFAMSGTVINTPTRDGCTPASNASNLQVFLSAP